VGFVDLDLRERVKGVAKLPAWEKFWLLRERCRGEGGVRVEGLSDEK